MSMTPLPTLVHGVNASMQLLGRMTLRVENHNFEWQGASLSPLHVFQEDSFHTR